MEKNVKVCVTGGAGYLASFLIKQLLERGYVVHATLRSLGDASKVGLLKGLSNAETRLKLFEADIYNPVDFESAIDGCEIVLLMATPLQHSPNTNSQYKDTIEAAVGGLKIIMESCMRSNSVKRVIYTGSVLAASPLKDDGSGYKTSMDETCWTPLNLPYEMLDEYIHSKTLAEKEVLSYNGKGLQVVSLVCGLVGGDTIHSKVSDTMAVLISQTTNEGILYKVLRFSEDLNGKIPIVHIQDVTEAHILSMENENINGRFLCASAFLKTAEIASLIQKLQQNISIPQEFIEDTKREIIWDSKKLEDFGFHYKYDAEKTINDTLLCAKRFGSLS